MFATLARQVRVVVDAENNLTRDHSLRASGLDGGAEKLPPIERIGAHDHAHAWGLC